jgi:hypothetical protein
VRTFFIEEHSILYFYVKLYADYMQIICKLYIRNVYIFIISIIYELLIYNFLFILFYVNIKIVFKKVYNVRYI